MADSPVLQMTRDIRKEISKEVERYFRTLRPAKLVLTFDTHAIQILVFPPSDDNFKVPGGPWTTTIRDGLVEE